MAQNGWCGDRGGNRRARRRAEARRRRPAGDAGRGGAPPGRQDASGSRPGRARRGRPDGLHHALGLRGDFSECGADLAPESRSAPPRSSPATPGADPSGSTSSPIPDGPRRPSPISREHGSRGVPTLPRPGRGDLPHARRAVHPRPAPGPVDLAVRAGPRGLGGLMRIQPFTTLWSALGEYFPIRACASSLPLRHLLRILAVFGACDPDARRPCRDGGRLDRRGAAVAAGARGGGSRGRARGDLALRRGRHRHHRRGRAGDRRHLDTGERLPATRVVANPDVAALADGFLSEWRPPGPSIPVLSPSARSRP